MKKKKHDGWCLLTPRKDFWPGYFRLSRGDVLLDLAKWECDWKRFEKDGFKIVPVRLVEVKI